MLLAMPARGSEELNGRVKTKKRKAEKSKTEAAKAGNGNRLLQHIDFKVILGIFPPTRFSAPQDQFHEVVSHRQRRLPDRPQIHLSQAKVETIKGRAKDGKGEEEGMKGEGTEGREGIIEVKVLI